MHLFLPPLLRLFPHIPLLTDRKFSCIHLLLSSKRYIVSCVAKSRILTLLDSAISAALLVRCSALVQHIDFIIVANKNIFCCQSSQDFIQVIKPCFFHFCALSPKSQYHYFLCLYISKTEVPKLQS